MRGWAHHEAPAGWDLFHIEQVSPSYVRNGWKADVNVGRFTLAKRMIAQHWRKQCRVGVRVFKVRGGGSEFVGLTASRAAIKARALRRTGLNDVEIFRSNGTRISQYALDQIVQSQA